MIPMGLVKRSSIVCSAEPHKYHDSTNLPLMVSLIFTLQRVRNTMKNTIDDADYIINWIDLMVINQCVKNFAHSHSMVPGGLPEMS